MRYRFAPAPKRPLISLTPLVDVVFILLIFFMLASSFLDWRVIDLKLLGRATGSAADKTPILVSIRNGGLELDGTAVADRELAARLAERLAGDAGRPVSIRAAAEVALQRSIDVLEIVKAAGAREVAFSPNPRDTP